METAGRLPPDPEVVRLSQAYFAISFGDHPIAERDALRAPMLADGWIYHGYDGSPIGFEGLTHRQTKNQLKIYERRSHDHRLFQHENTAILTAKVWSRGEDKGAPFEGCGSWATVMTRTPDGWKVAADIVGSEPNAHEEPSAAYVWLSPVGSESE